MKKKNMFYIITFLLCMMIYSPVFAREYQADYSDDAEYVVPDGAFIIGNSMFAYEDGENPEYNFNQFFNGDVLTSQVMLGSATIDPNGVSSLEELVIYNKVMDEWWINSDTGAELTDYPETFEILYINGVCIEDSCQTGAQGYRTITFKYWDADKNTVTKTVSVKLGDKIPAGAIPELTQVPGYSFKSWKIGTQEFDLNTAISENITLTASYDPVVYIINYFIGDDATFEGVDLTKDYTCAMDGINNEGCTALGSSRNVPKRPGYTFLGWSANPSGDALFDAGERIDSILTEGTKIALYAVWALKDYAISYDLAGGKLSGTIVYTYNVTGRTVSLPNPTRDGFTFNGWEGSTNVSISPANGRYQLTVNTLGNVTLIAKWTAKDYHIKYGTTTIPETVCTYATICTLDDYVPGVANNKDFMYWEYDGYAYYPGGAFTFYTGTSYPSTITLTPHYNNGTDYNITYNLDGGYFEGPVVTSYTYGTGISNLPTPVKLGYEFDGWTSNGTPIDSITTFQSGNVNLVANWSALSYTVQYEQNLHGSSNCTYGSSCIAGAKPTETEFSFKYWVDGEGHYYNPGDEIIPIFNSTGDGLEDITLSPVWNDGNSYNITYNLAGGSLSNAIDSYVYGIGTNLPVPTKEGFRFTGWKNASNQIVNNISSTASGDIELTAQWEQITFLYAYSNNGTITKDTYNYGTAVYVPQAPTDAPSENATFVGWYDTRTGNKVTNGAEITLTKDTVLVAKWNYANVYGIGYDLGGGQFASQPVITFAYPTQTSVNLLTPTKEGYTFDGWTIDGHASVTGNRLTITSGENILLTANWKKSVVNINYDFAGGMPGENTVYSFNYDYGTGLNINTIVLVDPTRDGYSFNGWTLTPIDGVRLFGNTLRFTKAVDVKVAANWEKNAYRVMFKVGDETVESLRCIHGELCDLNVSDPDPEEGYVFKYWIDENGAIYKNGTKAIFTSETTLTAVFSADQEYNITYELGGGHFTAAAVPKYQFAPAGGSEIPTALPSDEIIEREGYEFEGWCLVPNCSNSDMVVSLIGMTGDITLYAKWSAKTYNVTYYANIDGDEIQNSEENISYNETYTIENYLGNVPGKIFICWSYNGINYFPGDSINHYEENLELRPVFYDASTEVPHTITYVLNGGNLPENGILAPRYVVGDTFNIGTVSREGYNFKGWTLTEEDNGSYITTVAGLEEDVTLYAQWEGLDYSINLYNGDGTLLYQHTYTYGESNVIGVFYDADKDQNVYAWDIVPNGTDIQYRYDYDFADLATYTPNIVLYAIDNYDLQPITVTYDTNRIFNESSVCGVTDDEISVYPGEKIDFGDVADCGNTLLNDYSWYPVADYSTSPINLDTEITIDDQDMHIYGKYDAGYSQHTVTLIGHNRYGTTFSPVTTTVRWGLPIDNLQSLVIGQGTWGGNYYYDDFYWYL